MSDFTDRATRFFDRQLNMTSQALMGISAIIVAAAIFLPLWQIEVEAPMYMEDLEVTIYPYKLEGGGEDGQHMKEINVLNKQIGMRPLEEADFTELIWMPFALGGIALLSLRAMIFGRIRNAIDVGVLFCYVSIFGLYSFYHQMYTYGHDLDPSAPMNIEPFMPAVIGSNTIANMTQWSYPLWGSGLLFLYIVLVAVAVWWSRNENAPWL